VEVDEEGVLGDGVRLLRLFCNFVDDGCLTASSPESAGFGRGYGDDTDELSRSVHGFFFRRMMGGGGDT
jgi:hypothetical protein